MEGAPFNLSTPLLTKSLTFLTAEEEEESGERSVEWSAYIKYMQGEFKSNQWYGQVLK